MSNLMAMQCSASLQRLRALSVTEARIFVKLVLCDYHAGGRLRVRGFAILVSYQPGMKVCEPEELVPLDATPQLHVFIGPGRRATRPGEGDLNRLLMKCDGLVEAATDSRDNLWELASTT